VFAAAGGILRPLGETVTTIEDATASATLDDADEVRRRGAPLRPTLVVGIVNGMLVGPAIWTALYHPDRWTGPVDYLAHVQWMPNTFRHWWEPGIPHFLLHLIVRLVTAPFGTDDFRPGMLLAMVVLSGAFGAVLYRYFWTSLWAWGARRRTLVAAALATAIAAAEAPTALFGWSYQNPPAFFLPMNMPHSPTSLGGRVFAFGLFLLVVRLLRGDRGRYLAAVAPLAVASTFFKPYLSPTLCAVAVVWALLHIAEPDGRRRLRETVTRLAIPTGIAMIVQVVMPYPEVADVRTKRSIVIRPFHDLLMMDGGNPKFWTVLLVPLLAFALFRRRMISLEMRIALGCGAVALAIVTLLSMTGGVPYAADFLHFPQMAGLLLVVCVAHQLVRLAPTFDRADWIRAGCVAAVGLAYVVAGLNVWVCEGTSACLVH